MDVPADMDILYIRTEHEVSLTVKVGNDMFGPVPARGGFRALTTEVQKAFPDIWPTEKQLETVFFLLHFQFLSSGQNRAGVPYPFEGRL